MRPRSSSARAIVWVVAGLLWAGAVGACAEEETKERFDDDDSQGGTGGTPTAVGGTATGTGAGTTPTGTATGAGTSTGTGTAPCVNDGFEPNDDETNAVYLGEVSDCNGNEGTIDGVLEGTEFDWFWYHGIDDWSVIFQCNVGAHRVWTGEATIRV